MSNLTLETARARLKGWPSACAATSFGRPAKSAVTDFGAAYHAEAFVASPPQNTSARIRPQAGFAHRARGGMAGATPYIRRADVQNRRAAQAQEGRPCLSH